MKEYETMNGTNVVLVNNGHNCVWKSNKPIPCSFCKKYCDYMGQWLFDDKNIIFCYKNKKCFEFAMDEIGYIQDDYTMCRAIICPDNTGETRKKHRNNMSYKKRWQCLKRDNFMCVCCGSNESLEIDHILPISKGGNSDVENLQTLCFKCNRGKHAE